MRRFASLILLCLLLLSSMFSTGAYAGSKQIMYDDATRGSTGIVLTTPDTYSSCVDAVVTDKITTTGVGDRWLKGQVIVEFVTDAGRQLVPGGFYAVNQTGDLDLIVSYPPISQWPALANGTREIHVDIQIELFENGLKVATLGPGNDWDVYCVGNPPPPSGGQGCTPGYWKQPQHFDSYPAPYTAGSYFDVVFGVGPHITFKAALSAKGGGEQALLRHATAALLNAANPDVSYAYTVAGVIDLVKQAYDTNTFETVKNLFAMENERGCPLN